MGASHIGWDAVGCYVFGISADGDYSSSPWIWVRYIITHWGCGGFGEGGQIGFIYTEVGVWPHYGFRSRLIIGSFSRTFPPLNSGAYTKISDDMAYL